MKINKDVIAKLNPCSSSIVIKEIKERFITAELPPQQNQEENVE